MAKIKRRRRNEKAANTAVATSAASDTSAAPALKLLEVSASKCATICCWERREALPGRGSNGSDRRTGLLSSDRGRRLRRTRREWRRTLSKKKITIKYRRDRFADPALSHGATCHECTLTSWRGPCSSGWASRTRFRACVGGVLHLVPTWADGLHHHCARRVCTV